ncbi:MAG: LysM peptidoglycan-binding domain-containing protein [Treponemataceae bacterium]
MKKYIVLILLATTLPFFAEDYSKNMYQNLAYEFMQKADVAFGSGDYDLALEYTLEAEKNADLSYAYINSVALKYHAAEKIKIAQDEYKRVESIKAEENFPTTYELAFQALIDGESAFVVKNYENANNQAEQAIELFASIRDITPLPEYYIVRPWAESYDCYWNISSRPYVYNNPTLWENLYQANKSSMKQPSNPNLIMPGMKMKIPSINGEHREGTFDKQNKYEPFELKK